MKENSELKEKYHSEKEAAHRRDTEKDTQLAALQAQIQREMSQHQTEMNARTREMNDKLGEGKRIEMQLRNKFITKAENHATELQEMSEHHEQQMKDKDKEQLVLMEEMTELFQNEIKTAHHQWQRDLVNTWKLDPNDVDFGATTTIGTGRLGCTLKGNFRGIEVAVKKIHPQLLTEQNYKLVGWQINFLAQVRHPNLLLFLGAFLEDGKDENGSLIITELLDLSLHSAYKKDLIGEESWVPILGDVSSALAYLHTNRVPIVHGNISSSRILLRAIGGACRWTAKLSLFTLANVIPNAAIPCGPISNTTYTAPEVISGYSRNQTDKVDVYSFGVLICEVVLCLIPPENRDEFPVMLSKVSSKDHRLFLLAINCTKSSHEDRPSMIEVTKLLRT